MYGSSAGAPHTFPVHVGEYRIEPEYCIGIGSESAVYLAVHLQTDSRVAVKVVDKLQAPHLRERALWEARLLRKLHRHDHIVELLDVEETRGFIFLFMEWTPHGDMGSFIHRFGRFDEDIARTYFKQIISAVEHCHEHHVVHHDIKLENLMIASDSQIRLIDFGLAKILNTTAHSPLHSNCDSHHNNASTVELPVNLVQSIGGLDMSTSSSSSGSPSLHSSQSSQNSLANAPLPPLCYDFAGSPLYMSPELISRQPHDATIDIWSIGICLYYMVTDLFPFLADTIQDLEELVVFEDICFPVNMGLSENLQDLLRALLHKDPKKRITIQQIKQHSWWLQSRPCK